MTDKDAGSIQAIDYGKLPNRTLWYLFEQAKRDVRSITGMDSFLDPITFLDDDSHIAKLKAMTIEEMLDYAVEFGLDISVKILNQYVDPMKPTFESEAVRDMMVEFMCAELADIDAFDEEDWKGEKSTMIVFDEVAPITRKMWESTPTLKPDSAGTTIHRALNFDGKEWKPACLLE